MAARKLTVVSFPSAVGRAVPVAATNANEPAALQQEQEQTDPTRNPSGATTTVHQAFSGGNSGVRVVPLRTAVAAVPSGVSPLPSDSAVSSVRLFYPLLARVRQISAGNASDVRGVQASSQPQQSFSEVDRQPVHQSPAQRQNLDSNRSDAVRDNSPFPANTVPFVSGPSPPENESAAYQGQYVCNTL